MTNYGRKGCEESWSWVYLENSSRSQSLRDIQAGYFP